jgi:hypothetical protein
VVGVNEAVVAFAWDDGPNVRGRVTVFLMPDMPHAIRLKVFTILGMCVANHIPYEIGYN